MRNLSSTVKTALLFKKKCIFIYVFSGLILLTIGENADHWRQSMEIKVECYAGYRGEETPRRIWIGNRKIEVKEIQDRWLAPTHRYFKIHGDDNAIYILRHSSESWEWDMTFYEQMKNHSDVA